MKYTLTCLLVFVPKNNTKSDTRIFTFHYNSMNIWNPIAINYFYLQGYAINHELRLKDRHLSECFANWVFTKLHVYYHYYLYGEPNNYDVTRALYAKRTQFPFNFYYPSTYQKAAHDIISVMGGFDIDDKLEDHDVEYVSMILMKYEKYQLMEIFYINLHYSSPCTNHYNVRSMTTH